MSLGTPLHARPLSSPAGRRDSPLWLPPRGVVALFLIWLLTRWAVAALRELVPDEAYYWVWSRHLAASYLDHPPVIAWLIRLGTILLGGTELGVRCLMGVMTAGTVLILTVAARRVVGNARAASFVPIALLLSPMIAVVGSVATPDTPACFFQSAALASVLGIFAPSPGEGRRGLRWLMFGILMGLALDSKYTSVLLGVAVILALISCPEGRRHFLTPWPWLAAILAAAVFSPVIFWNARNHWASFQFQLRHGITSGDSAVWRNLLDYAGGQIAICTPVLLGVCLTGLAIYWRRKNNPMPIRILLFAATVPLLFFGWSATHRRVEANWPMFAYFPAVILFARYLAENWSPRRVFWAELAIITAFVATVAIHCPELFWKLSPKMGTPQWDNLFGWRDLATREVEPLRLDSPVFAADYGYAAELSFYLPTRPDVRPLADPTRATAFDFFGDQASPRSFARVVLVRRLPKGYDPPLPWPALGPDFSISNLSDPSEYRYGRQIRRSLIEVAVRRRP
ncbi:MAG: glycosyltransferase family 39 protein [Tepidisphaeraceae bacterium]